MRVALGALLLAISAIDVASAHHSPAMFDQTQRVTLQGTVRKFKWSNPHAYVQLLVTDASGQQVEWTIEAAAPPYLEVHGWKPSTLKPGDEVTMVVAPLRRQGKVPGALLIQATRADGTPIGRDSGRAP